MMDLAELHAAKRELAAKFGKREWFRGVGIAPLGKGFVLRLNVDPLAGAKAAEIPSEYRGIPVRVVYIGQYRPRGTAG